VRQNRRVTAENLQKPDQDALTAERKKRQRERWAIVALLVVFVALTVFEFRLTRVSEKLPFVNSIFFFGLLNVNLILLIALVWLIFRNIGKLFLERRSRVLGSRLKTKLVVAFLAFSITPTLILFTVSSLYINSSFDKWFSIKVQNTLQASLEITRTYYKNSERVAMHFGEHLATQIGKRVSNVPSRFRPPGSNELPLWLPKYLEDQRALLALHAVEYYADPLSDRLLTTLETSENVSYPRLSLDLLDRAFSGENVSVIHHIGSGDLIRCLVPVFVGGRKPASSSDEGLAGVVVINSYIPVSLVNKVDEVASVFDDYKDTNPLKYPLKTAYFVILVMITMVMIVVAIWMGLYLARELTVPVERLVRGAQLVGSGNLDVTIERSGEDEIGTLIESFNAMTRDLKQNRMKLTEAGHDLETRKLQLEAVLANIGTGVLVVSPQGEITTFNRAAAELLEIEPESALKRPYTSVLTDESQALVEIIAQATAQTEDLKPEVIQWTFRSSDGTTRSLAGIASSLRDSQAFWGVVVVIDDMSHLMKAQREVAWREVARRIAHEIKNPLTPIKLSAQRLQRQLGHTPGKEGALLRECTETIVKHTDELKEMVNEFSNFARFPEASPAPHQLNEVILEVMRLFSQAHPEIWFETNLEQKLPIFDFDRDQIKRVLINLLDNAIAALGDAQGQKKIKLESHYNEPLQIAVFTVEDNGPGMSEEIRDRVFEPYFSTKKEGTGLGLAITKRIVSDHDGFIRVHSGLQQGTQFVIELPTAPKKPIEDVALKKGPKWGTPS
jgi:two-component system nitrogen regulation sensor histidine kinase NtrY